MAKKINWVTIEEEYQKNFSGTKGEEAYSARLAFGTLVIKEFFKFSDREAVNSIKENPYLQYFLGLPGYSYDFSLHPSCLTHFRKRFSGEAVARINKVFIENEMKEADPSKGKSDKPQPPSGDPETPSERSNECSSDEQPVKNRGTIILDATCCPADIQFPTDVRLVHEARLKSEEIMDHLQAGCRNKKPRNYRQRANVEYKRYVRNRRPSHKERRSVLRRQLGYLERNLNNIKGMQLVSSVRLSARQLSTLETINKLYRQQYEMWKTNSRRCPDRIVSLHQPHVRPIVRGKAKAKVEFGAKVSIIVNKGFIEISKLSWDAYNESTELIQILETYRQEHGYYPQKVLVDKIYRTAENIAFCKAHGIHINGPKLGRPSSDETEYRAQKALERRESGQRNAVEGKFGEGKRRYGLSCIMTKLKETSESQIQTVIFTMNLVKALRGALRRLFFVFFVTFFNTLTSFRVNFGPRFAHPRGFWMRSCEFQA